VKTELIVIRCRPETKRRFKVFIADKGFRNAEEALIFLLNHYEKTSIEAEVFG